MLVSRRFLAASSAAALAAVAGDTGAVSAAPTIATKIPCVANLGLGGAMTLPLTGSGFTPNGVVALQTSTRANPKPKDLTSVSADPGGNDDQREGDGEEVEGHEGENREGHESGVVEGPPPDA